MLTPKKIEALKPREKRFSVADRQGLTLRVQPSGKKIWYVRAYVFGRSTDKKIGEFPEMSLIQARQKARKLRKEVGLVPPKGYVLRDAFKLWCKLKQSQIVSYKDEKRRLEKYIIEPLGGRQLDEITAPVVIQAVLPIEQEGKKSHPQARPYALERNS